MTQPDSGTRPVVEIHTDGACSGNPGPGGWAALVRFGDVEKTLSGGTAATTNNRMELTAAIEALKVLKRPCSIRLFSDSAYLVSAFKEQWMEKWKRNGWKNAGGDPVSNIDLWTELDRLAGMQERQVRASWLQIRK